MFFSFGRFLDLELPRLLNYKSEGTLEGKKISVITAKAVLRILFLIQIFIFHSSDNSPVFCRLN